MTPNTTKIRLVYPPRKLSGGRGHSYFGLAFVDWPLGALAWAIRNREEYNPQRRARARGLKNAR